MAKNVKDNGPRVDEPTGTEFVGHEWDGIRELNTPLPKWWLYIFYATIVWALGYVIAYPALPLVSGFTKGVLGYASRDQIARAEATETCWLTMAPSSAVNPCSRCRHGRPAGGSASTKRGSRRPSHSAPQIAGPHAPRCHGTWCAAAGPQCEQRKPGRLGAAMGFGSRC